MREFIVGFLVSASFAAAMLYLAYRQIFRSLRGAATDE